MNAALERPAVTAIRALPASTRRERALHLLGPRTAVLAGVMAVIAAIVTSANRDPDFWWHLRDGQWILAHGRLPVTDLYTFTATGHAWVDHEYLSEIGLWVLHSWGGAVAVSVVFGALTWAAFALLFQTSEARRRPYLIAGAGLALGAAVAVPVWGPRIQMITFLFVCVELHWLRRYLQGRSRALYALPALVLVWANLHGGWAVAFAFLAVALVAVGWAALTNPREPEYRRRVRNLVLVTVGSAAAVAFTPEGLALYAYPFQTLGSSVQQNLIVEWLSPNFHDVRMRFFEAALLLLLAGFALRKPSLYDLLLCLAGTALALQSMRNLPLFTAAVTPTLIATWSDIWEREGIRLPWRLPRLPASAFVSTISMVLLAGALVGSAQHVTGELSYQRDITAANFPVAAADWMAANPDRVGSRMLNLYSWGGYLAYRFYPNPDRRVFVFGEAELMGDPLLLDYERVQDLRPGAGGVLQRYRIDTIVFSTGSPLDVFLSTQKDWKAVYRDRVAVVYARSAG